MGFHIQMRNKVSYIKNLMEITIDILMVALFEHNEARSITGQISNKNI